MADTKSNQTHTGKESSQAIARPERERRDLRRWEQPGGYLNPFDFFDRVSDEMDRAFDRLWRGAGFSRRPWTSRSIESARERGFWSPRVESFQKGDQYVVRAELPGLKKEDVELELTEDALTIRGERHQEREEEREGVFHSEREYGEFYRTIPLPEGVISESAKASFRNGVLEVTMQAPPSSTTRGRRLEIKEASESEQKK
jgi:HSP20 family protein